MEDTHIIHTHTHTHTHTLVAHELSIPCTHTHTHTHTHTDDISGKRQLLKHRRDVHLNEKGKKIKEKNTYILGTRQLLKQLRDVVHLKKKAKLKEKNIHFRYTSAVEAPQRRGTFEEKRPGRQDLQPLF